MRENEQLTDRVRKALARTRNVKEKRMFGRVVFMVNGKMCVTSGGDRLMLRIGPESHAVAIKQKGVRPVIMRGREYKGFVHVKEDALKSKRNFDRWISLALKFNIQAAKSKRK